MSIEDLINNHKEMFSNEEPEPGHLNRFEERIRREQRRRRMQGIIRLTASAAAVLVLMVSSVLVYERFFDQPSEVASLSDINPELGKVEYFYTSRIDQLTTGIDSLAIYSDEETQALYKRELAEMDSLRTKLSSQLGDYPSDDRLINAMIRYYQTRLKIMENFVQTLNQIKQNNQLKSQNYESTVL